ncbi:unnamed protein product [Dracunculus medinensis]|uniref:Persulfide dioxygenase ETHE1, mitochondrial n=1 Tax=Dracunculus medinensis TaxID=318479 RepID=A0A3P7QQF5_DRAME|nr:unnamed protein product [Dracunculus medinensis]
MFSFQLFEPISCTYTYILACASTRKTVIIDPVLETVERDAKLIQELNLKPLYAANTHVHADHITGSGELKRIFPRMKSVLSKHSGGVADMFVDDGDLLLFGDQNLEIRATPGHTDGNIFLLFYYWWNQVFSYIFHPLKKVFTGDALLIRGCGRTDFQQGNSAALYEAIHKKIFVLPDDFEIYPGHDYKGILMSTVGEEKKYNPRLTKPLKEFVEIMDKLNLGPPKQIDKAVPANKVCGVYELMDDIIRQKIWPNK